MIVCVEGGHRFAVTFEGLVLVRALYYEVNASVFAACGKLNFLVGYLFVACKELSSHIGLARIGSSCINEHIIRIPPSSRALGMMQTNIILLSSQARQKYSASITEVCSESP